MKYCYYDLLNIKFILVSGDFGIVLFIVNDDSELIRCKMCLYRLFKEGFYLKLRL